ncbi:MAG TPA: exodeoxyribonuclease VII large subunit, partial [Oxalicibacterium sp.]
LAALSAQLDMLNPQRTLERGYAIVTDEKGQIVRTPRQLQPHKHVTLRLADGTAQIGIASVQQPLDGD